MYGYTMAKDGKFSLFSYPTDAAFCMHQGATKDGSMIAGYYTEKGVTRGYILTPKDGAVTTFEIPGAKATAVQDISWNGVIVGQYRKQDETTQFHGFVIDTHMSTDKSKWEFKYPIDYQNAPVTRFRGVNDKNEIVGDYTGTDNVTHAFVAKLTKK